MNLTNRIHISQYQYLLIILLSTFICGYEDFENQLSQIELILTVITCLLFALEAPPHYRWPAQHSSFSTRCHFAGPKRKIQLYKILASG